LKVLPLSLLRERARVRVLLGEREHDFRQFEVKLRGSGCS